MFMDILIDEMVVELLIVAVVDDLKGRVRAWVVGLVKTEQGWGFGWGRTC